MKDGAMQFLLLAVLALTCVIAGRAAEPQCSTETNTCKASEAMVSPAPQITIEMSLAYYAALSEYQPAQAQAEAAKVKLDAAIATMTATCGERGIVPSQKPVKFECGPPKAASAMPDAKK